MERVSILYTKSIFKRLERQPSSIDNEETSENFDCIKIYVRVPFASVKGEQLLKQFVRKLRRYTKPNTVFVTLFDTKKFSKFCPTKDKIPRNQKANLIYQIVCPGCGEKYIGKTDRCVGTRMDEHGTREDQPLFRYLSPNECQ